MTKEQRKEWAGNYRELCKLTLVNNLLSCVFAVMALIAHVLDGSDFSFYVFVLVCITVIIFMVSNIKMVREVRNLFLKEGVFDED